ncbi:protein transport protein Sec24C isoform X1 [Octopus bimaculoides]|uniref:Protein transport protein Sec24C n=1 Tax=Octopus bimaculoides TaxID=37653 RepID=A0A0L8HPT8_OCTBM|nr:protein transport protein Sec24C isoform X1 [Octopus bimaculoides]XP_014770484.1 protein transport protein Sec24C isoform X1 [Octopus bimaculoides]|eukprot:XP_014770483.1 PREDICTED: protein transport protein Sec24C-like isoform X1 [Octopus bimaculoides]
MHPQYHSGFGPGVTPHGGGIQVSAATPSRPHLPGQNMYNGPNMVQRPPGIRGPTGFPPMKQGMGPPGQYEMSGHAQNGPQTDNANFRNYPTDGSRMVSVPSNNNQPHMGFSGQPGSSSQQMPPPPPTTGNLHQPSMMQQFPNRPTGAPPNQVAGTMPVQMQNQYREAPPMSQITPQMAGMSINQDGRYPQTGNLPPPPTNMSVPQQTNVGPPIPSNVGPPQQTNVGPPQQTSYCPPPSSIIGPNQQINAGPSPPSSIGPPFPSSAGPLHPPNVGPPLQSSVGPPPTSSVGSRPVGQVPMDSYAPNSGPNMGSQSNYMQPSQGYGSAPPSMNTPVHSGILGQVPPQPHMMGQGPPPSSSAASSTYGVAPPQSIGPPPQFSAPPSSGPYAGSSSQMPSGGYHTGSHSGMQPQQPRRLDPDQMPSPIQVIEDDKQNKSGIFTTNVRGQVPPLITTNFVTQDQGNSNPRFIRSTMYNVPCTADMLKNSHIPFALTITPFAKLHKEEHVPPLVDLGDLGPVRCKRCKSYMSPHMQFIDGGRRFQCVFCNAATEVPSEYFAHLDHTGRRVDCYDRAELCLGSYEFVATKDYCKNGKPPNCPAFIFCIDVSYNSVRNGLVHLICSRLKKEILVNLPRETGAAESEIRVGFLTYAKEIHFYNVKGSLAQPQMLVVSDIEDVFMPLLDGFLVKLSECETVIDSLLSQIPQMFGESRETEVILGPVIQAGLEALINADCAGKLILFHTSLPIADVPGKLKNRDDRKLLGTDKEKIDATTLKTLLTPQGNFYTKLGQQCVAAGCSVDLFLFPNSYVDIATIGELCRLTGGNMYKYSYFQAEQDGERFMNDLKRNVCQIAAFDAIIRVRTSTGIRPVDFFGNFYMTNATDVELSAIDSDQSISVEIKHDDKLDPADGAYVQVAILYTSVGGFRRLRIHNLSLNCCTQFADMFRNCELDSLINFMAKQAIRNILNSTPKLVHENMANQVAHILHCYRKNCANPSSAGQLILPECMKLLPLYANCVIKSDAIQGGSEVPTDDRSYCLLLLNAMDVKSTNVFFYPRLLPLHHIDESISDELVEDYLPKAVRCSLERLDDNGIYFLENGLTMYLWLGHNVSPEWVQMVFGVQSAAQIDIDKCKLIELDNPLSQRIRSIIRIVQQERSRQMKLIIVRQRDKLEPWFNHFLVEDKGMNGSASYVDFLCHIHKEIRNLLS